MIEELLPSGVRCAEAFDDLQEVPLYAEEEKAVVGAVDKRRREFATVRGCARRAMAELGLPPMAVPRGDGGAPVWPSSVVGSMTHCDGYRACAVAWERDVVTLGIDAEPAQRLPADVVEAISRPEERTMLAELTEAWSAFCWDRLLFCAKEAVYKAWYPLARQWLDFHDASVELSLDHTFTAQLHVPGPAVGPLTVTGFTGRWLARDGLLLTAISRCKTAPWVPDLAG
ncbi:4'-phosphopantetheinyl transferase family protein [Phytoactinopolyspora halotolerans]|uniref:4'-phosphopantetheinyl transferase superfamily protein n=1 Tax=Phytoactinopolyspora halotolerans TaxID=1981512 RepID=A0A6L9S1P7_9ACTN|nr:4'-phosphopantetheinyl transferase superfamily protein [Phytoactinopolyspora halotolerans]NED99424.1 4'-phosphopantetheinyl transferase superfamily protein [Phytoactinopolyspora halotolerans]